MPVHFAVIALLLLAHPTSTWGVRDTHSRIGSWTLRVHSDRFSGGVSCRLSQRHVEYQRGALVFHVSRQASTLTSVYRIDGGAPRAASADGLELARMGFAVYQDDLANPSGGVVRIPARRLQGAKSVAIEVWREPVAFDITDLGAALDAAGRAGCSQDAFN